MLQDRVSHEICGCGRAGTGKFGSLCTEPSASDQISFSPVCVTEVHWSFHQSHCCTDVAQTLGSSAFPRRARPEAGTCRGRKVELLSEGYQSVPETADVSSTGNVLPPPASKELKGSWRLSVTCVPLRAFPLRRLGKSPAPPAPRCRRRPPCAPALCQGPGAS